MTFEAARRAWADRQLYEKEFFHHRDGEKQKEVSMTKEEGEHWRKEALRFEMLYNGVSKMVERKAIKYEEAEAELEELKSRLATVESNSDALLSIADALWPYIETRVLERSQ